MPKIRKNNTRIVQHIHWWDIFKLNDLLDVDIDWIENWQTIIYDSSDKKFKPWSWWTFEQWTWYQDDTYLYVVFWVDDDWEAVRFTRDLQEKKTTWPHQTWPKPTTLEEVQSLDYLYDYS